MGADGQSRRAPRCRGPGAGDRSAGLKLERLGGGREAEVFAWSQGRALRLGNDPSRASDIEREALALAAASGAGAPVPAVYEQVTVDGRPGVVMDRIDGDDLLTWLGRRPWAVWSAGRTLGREHAALHRVEAPAALPALREDLRRRLRSELVPEDVRRLALERLERLADGGRLCHGDFHPANMLQAANGYVVIDWTTGARGQPAADVARTLVLLRVGAVQDDAPAVVRRLARVGRRLLVSAYLQAYGLELPLDRALVARWFPVQAAARLAEGIAGERAKLLRLAG